MICDGKVTEYMYSVLLRPSFDVAMGVGRQRMRQADCHQFQRLCFRNLLIAIPQGHTLYHLAKALFKFVMGHVMVNEVSNLAESCGWHRICVTSSMNILF